jgi:hypothetical protein
VERVLPPAYGQAQAAIQDAQVGVATQANPEIKTAVPGVGVIPETIIGIAVTGCGVKYRLSGLVNGVIIKFG